MESAQPNSCESMPLEKYGTQWNTEPMKPSIETKTANIQASLANKIKQDLARNFNQTNTILRNMSNADLQRLGYDESELKTCMNKIDSFDYAQKFPGSNPVSFSDVHMYRMQHTQTVVCEKSDGVRFFLCEVMKNGTSTWLLIDRSYYFRQVSPSFDMADFNPTKYL